MDKLKIYWWDEAQTKSPPVADQWSKTFPNSSPEEVAQKIKDLEKSLADAKQNQVKKKKISLELIAKENKTAGKVAIDFQDIKDILNN